MIERIYQSIKKCFSNPKKLVLGTIAVVVIFIAILVINLRKTLVLNINGQKTQIVTYKSTVKDILKQYNINPSKNDYVSIDLNKKLNNNDVITYKKAKCVIIKTVNDELKMFTTEDTVEKVLLSNKELNFDNDDETIPSKDTKIKDNMLIQLIKVDIKNTDEKESIKFETIVENDSSMSYGLSTVKNQGNNGEKLVTYKNVYKDGKLFAKRQVKEKILKQPVNKVILKGTNKKVASRGGNITFLKQLDCVTTAYIPTGNLTSTGTIAKRDFSGYSTVAVDPSFIPMGSKLYIEGYGYAIASDTGGAIRGNIIDLFVNSHSEAVKWGRKNSKVYIIQYP